MTVKELSELVHGSIEVKSGYSGKILCRDYNGKKHGAISDREVTAVWPEIRATNGPGYSNYAKPVICVFVYGDREAGQSGEDKG